MSLPDDMSQRIEALLDREPELLDLAFEAYVLGETLAMFGWFQKEGRHHEPLSRNNLTTTERMVANRFFEKGYKSAEIEGYRTEIVAGMML